MTLATPGTYIPNRNDARFIGLDFSSNNGLIDFGKTRLADPRPRFLMFRTGISWGYKDKYFRLFWAGAEPWFPRSPYHVLYPMEPIAAQVKNFMSMFPDKDFGEGPIVNDCELIHGATRHQLSNACEAFSKALEDATGREVMVYARYSFVRDYMEFQSWMERRRWIMATYIDGQKYPPVREWSTGPEGAYAYDSRLPVAMLQTGDKGDGIYYGATSKQVDTDRWLLSEEEFKRTFSQPAQPQPEPAPVIGDVEKLDRLWQAHPELHGA
ncbi:MAG TPA: GH25 family lysozyme [Anaerolineaceae bacterium]|nr:GH25 family lysozyme [Anaerolineaceae bacterium]